MASLQNKAINLLIEFWEYSLLIQGATEAAKAFILSTYYSSVSLVNLSQILFS